MFCASLADWLDPEIPTLWLADLLVLIDATPNLDWLLLTKRPELWRARMEEIAEPFVAGDPHAHPGSEIAYDWACGFPLANVWVGTTVEDQKRSDERIPALLSIPACVRFLSCEPLLSAIDLSQSACDWWESSRINWVICGGESGANARPMHPAWARSLRDQCSASAVPFLFKQWGAFGPALGEPTRRSDDTSQTWVCEDGSIHEGLHLFEGMAIMERVGKKRAGRLLDGRTWDEFPATVTA